MSNTLSAEEHHVLDSLSNRINGTHGCAWYERTTKQEFLGVRTYHTWFCRICNSVIHKNNTMMGSGSILKDHGLQHLKEHNLLLFI